MGTVRSVPAEYLPSVGDRAHDDRMTKADAFDVDAWFEQGERESAEHEAPDTRRSARFAAVVMTTFVIVGLLLVAL